MTDLFQSRKATLKNINLTANEDLATQVYVVENPLDTMASGYEGEFIIDISDLAIKNLIVDIDVWMEDIRAAGGGTSDFNYIKLPFTRYASNATVQDSAYSEVFYNSLVNKDGESYGEAFLRIVYRNNFSATTYPRFIYKVSNRSVLAFGN